jgi:transcriptional regulator of arginine metabolism
MPKQSRHFAIKEIVASSVVTNQDELRHKLKSRGFVVTQATLSRDLHELGVSRVSTGDTMKYVIQPAATESQILRPLVGAQIVSIRQNETMIVVRTLSGSASVVAEFLDTLTNTDIIGTLAGDNTLLVIPSSQQKTHRVVEFLKHSLIEGKA